MQLRCLSERQFLWLPAHTKYSFWLELHRQEMKMARKCRAHYILVCSIISCLGNCNAPTSVIIFIKSSKFLKSIHFLFICYISLSSFQTVFRCLLQVKPMNQTIFLWTTGEECPWDVKCRKSQTKKSFLIELWFCPKFILFLRALCIHVHDLHVNKKDEIKQYSLFVLAVGDCKRKSFQLQKYSTCHQYNENMQKIASCV